jgi:hypothetical protein
VTVCKKLFYKNNTEGQQCFVPNGSFAELNEDDDTKRQFKEFNSLSIIYKAPSIQFIKDEYQMVRTIVITLVVAQLN